MDVEKRQPSQANAILPSIVVVIIIIIDIIIIIIIIIIIFQAKESQSELHRLRNAREKRTQRIQISCQSKLDGKLVLILFVFVM